MIEDAEYGPFLQAVAAVVALSEVVAAAAVAEAVEAAVVVAEKLQMVLPPPGGFPVNPNQKRLMTVGAKSPYRQLLAAARQLACQAVPASRHGRAFVFAAPLRPSAFSGGSCTRSRYFVASSEQLSPQGFAAPAFQMTVATLTQSHMQVIRWQNNDAARLLSVGADAPIAREAVAVEAEVPMAAEAVVEAEAG